MITSAAERNALDGPASQRIRRTKIVPVHRGPGIILNTGGEDDIGVGVAFLKHLHDGGGVVRCAVAIRNDARFSRRGKGRAGETE